MRWLRAIAVWVLLMFAETVHGVARTLFLAPAVGDFRARQLAVVRGSLVILAIGCLTIRWVQPHPTRWLVSIGVMRVALTLAFEIGLGRLAGYSWNRTTTCSTGVSCPSVEASWLWRLGSRDFPSVVGAGPVS